MIFKLECFFQNPHSRIHVSAFQVHDPNLMRKPTPDPYAFYVASYESAAALFNDLMVTDRAHLLPLICFACNNFALFCTSVVGCTTSSFTTLFFPFCSILLNCGVVRLGATTPSMRPCLLTNHEQRRLGVPIGRVKEGLIQRGEVDRRYEKHLPMSCGGYVAFLIACAVFGFTVYLCLCDLCICEVLLVVPACAYELACAAWLRQPYTLRMRHRNYQKLHSALDSRYKIFVYGA